MISLTPGRASKHRQLEVHQRPDQAAAALATRSTGCTRTVVDFDAPIRAPANPARINLAYAGADHLHFNLAGHRAMGNAVPLDQIVWSCVP